MRILCIATAVVSSSLFSSSVALSLDSRTQRRLSSDQGPQLPIEQIRMLLRGNLEQGRVPTADQLAAAMNLNKSQGHPLAETLKSFGSGVRGSRIPSTSPRKADPSKAPDRLQQLREELGLSERDSAAGPTEDRWRTRPRKSESDGKRPAGSQQIPGRNRRSRALKPPTTDSSAANSTTESGQRQEAGHNILRELSRKLGHGEFSSILSGKLPDAQTSSVKPSSSAVNNHRSGRHSPRDHTPSFDISRELSRHGLERTLERLVRDVRKKVQQQNSAPADNPSDIMDSSIWSQALAKIVDTMREDVAEIVRDSENQRKRTRRSSDVRSRQNVRRNPRSNLREEPVIEKPHTGASATGQSSQSPNAPADSASTDFSAWPDQTLSLYDGYAAQFFLLLSALGVAALALLFAARRKNLMQLEQQRRTLAAVKPELIRTGADVIHTFHWLTHCQLPDAADWWNHLKAEESLTSLTPERHQSLETLTQLYEAARYQPSGAGLNASQIQQARTALAGYLS